MEQCEDSPLRTTSYDDIGDRQCVYVLGFLAIAVLVDEHEDGDNSMWRFWERSERDGYYSAFQSTFGIALGDFYQEFAKSKTKWGNAGCGDWWEDKVVDMDENPECWSYSPQVVRPTTEVVGEGNGWEPGPNDLRSGELVRLRSDDVKVYYVTYSARGSATVRHIPTWADFTEANCAESDIRHVHYPSQQVSYGAAYPEGEFQRNPSRHCH